MIHGRRNQSYGREGPWFQQDDGTSPLSQFAVSLNHINRLDFLYQGLGTRPFDRMDADYYADLVESVCAVPEDQRWVTQAGYKEWMGGAIP